MTEYVSVMTDKGRIVGPLHHIDETSGRAFVNHISSGSVVSGPVQSVRPASDDEKQVADAHVTWARVMTESQSKISDALSSVENARRAEKLLDMARSMGMSVREAGCFYKISDPGAHGSIYLSKNCKRIDISDMTVDHHLVREISEDEARARRLGKIRAQAVDIKADELDDLWKACLKELSR